MRLPLRLSTIHPRCYDVMSIIGGYFGSGESDHTYSIPPEKQKGESPLVTASPDLEWFCRGEPAVRPYNKRGMVRKGVLNLKATRCADDFLLVIVDVFQQFRLEVLPFA